MTMIDLRPCRSSMISVRCARSLASRGTRKIIRYRHVDLMDAHVETMVVGMPDDVFRVAPLIREYLHAGRDVFSFPLMRDEHLYRGSRLRAGVTPPVVYVAYCWIFHNITV